VKVGFAAESHDVLENAARKLLDKGVHLIAANDITEEGSGFGTDTNRVTLLDREGQEELPLLSKYDVAWRILDRVVSLIQTQQRQEV
jgi:phosphopantothenoylcysteine decarboxylase/phosphopantothenate--cysteine ligase